ncbi:N-6 DNA methylase [Avibacterium paragallinarum]|uniref:N-6 DNA methylase n=1 Tax=Avibacterium paragallinarum TaxID=728 RepID=UPI0039873FAF
MSYQDFYQCADRQITQHSEFESYLKELLFKKSEREDFYRRLLAKNHDVSCDTFKDYFEQYAAERKSNKQDYTPNAVAELLSILTNGEMSEPNGYTAYDPTAGTGSLIIKRWYADMMQETIFSYATHRYFYLCEELADNAIPYLLHNLALRGMNAIVIHGNTLEREAKQVYFIQNSKDDCMCFSDINVMPHSEDIAKEFNIQNWLEPEIKHIESGLVIGKHTLPMQRQPLIINTEYKEQLQKEIKPYEGAKLKDVATIERVKKTKFTARGQ